MVPYKKIDDYVGKRFEYSYPADNIDPSLKQQQDWYYSVCSAIIADYANNYCYVPFEFGTKRTFQTLRAYATGQQGSSKLKDTVLGAHKKRADGTYATKMNISWDNYYILPKMFDIMRDKNMQAEYDVEVSCIDEDSLATKEAEKATLKYLLHPQTQEFLSKSNYKLPAQNDPKTMGMQNSDDVDLFFDTGGYTMQREMACIAASLKTKMVSGYKVTQDSTFDDLISVALTGWKTYIEKSTKLPKIRKVVIDRAIIPYSELNDFGDITRAAEIRVMTIADVSRENPDLTSAQLLYLAKSFSWYNPEYTRLIGTKGWYGRQNENNFSNFDTDPISRVKVMVLDAQWLSTDIETNIKNVRSDGDIFFTKAPHNFEPDAKSKRNKDEVIRKNTIRKYYAQWIIGTDMFLDYGVCSDVVYYGEDGNKTPKLDYFFVKTGNASLVERCIALVDDIDLAIIKQRNTLATVPAAPGLAIQKDLIENVFLNGIRQQPEDILQALIERGVLYYNGLDDHGKPLYMAGGAKPIDFLDVTKIVGVLKTYSDIVVEKVNEIREVLGIPQGADGSTPQEYDGLGKTQLSIQASNSALYPTFNSYSYLFRNAFDDIIKKWQIVAKDTGAKIGFSPLGIKNMKILELGKDFSNAEFNIDIQMGTTDAQKQALLSSIQQQKALGDQTGGAQGLNVAEWMYIYDRVIGGNIREAMYVMAQIQQKKAKQAAAAKQQDIQANAVVQQQTVEQKQQGDAQNIQLKGQVDGSNDAMVQLVKELGQQNKMLMQEFLKNQTAQGQPINGAQVAGQVQTNNSQIAALLNPQQSQMPVQGQDGLQPPPDEQPDLQPPNDNQQAA